MLPACGMGTGADRADFGTELTVITGGAYGRLIDGFRQLDHVAGLTFDIVPVVIDDIRVDSYLRHLLFPFDFFFTACGTSGSSRETQSAARRRLSTALPSWAPEASRSEASRSAFAAP